MQNEALLIRLKLTGFLLSYPLTIWPAELNNEAKSAKIM